MTSFVLGTANPDKAREISEILGALHLIPRPADIPDVPETGSTLVENARLKAHALAAATGMPAIADDTGLEVDALDGAPGVYSARFAGDNASYRENVELLLRRLVDVPPPRTARFVTAAVAAWPDGTDIVSVGAVDGTIASEPRGQNGFGYDPVFVPAEGGGLTFSEMTVAEKNRISHRARAFEALRPQLCGSRS